MSRVDHVQFVELKVVQRHTHAGRQAWRIAALELHTYALLVFEHQQVELRALVRRPEIGLIGLRNAQHLFQRKAFPAGARQWMRQHLPKAHHHGGWHIDAQQRQVAADVPLHGCLSPLQAYRFVAGQLGSRKTTPELNPMHILAVNTGFADIKAANLKRYRTTNSTARKDWSLALM